MKCLSLTQPYATLIAIGAKRIETRSWKTDHRGELAIHAAKGFPKWAQDVCLNDPFRTALGWPSPRDLPTQAWADNMFARIKELPLGVVLATCKLVDCLPTDYLHWKEPGEDPYWETSNGQRLVSQQEIAFGDYECGRWAWILEDVAPLAQPMPAIGKLGLWEWTP